MKSSYEIVRDALSEEEILCQLAEEASELAQAALKLRRAMDGTNPTPVTKDNALAALCEEIGDVLNCIDVLGADFELAYSFAQSRLKKMQRWAERLTAKED